MLRGQTDWRHYAVAALLTLTLLGLLWKWTLDSAPPLPDAPAPAGSHPSPVAPDSPG